jgi:hypothetical protein
MLRSFLRTTRTVATAVTLASAFSVSSLVAQSPLTFEEVPTNTAGLNNNFSSLAGYTFFNWSVATTTSLGSGTNANSGTKFALGQDNFSSIFRPGNERFSVFSMWLSFRQFDVTMPDNSPVSITVEGYRAGDVTPTFSRVISITNIAQQFTFNWLDIEEFSFETGNLNGPNRTVALAMDDFSHVVPEPSTYLLMGTGLTVLLVVRRRTREG